jgi:hypothetical protein
MDMTQRVGCFYAVVGPVLSKSFLHYGSYLIAPSYIVKYEYRCTDLFLKVSKSTYLNEYFVSLPQRWEHTINGS